MIIIAWIVLSIILAWYGGDRRIGFWGAFFLSLLLSPLIGFIAVVLSERTTPPEVRVVNQPAAAEQKMHWDVEQTKSPISVADEIEKLRKLRDQGVIDDIEFQQLKKKLLS